MNVVFRTSKSIIETTQIDAITEFKIVTRNFLLTDIKKLSFFHTGNCRIIFKASSLKHDYFVDNVFAYNQDQSLLIFIDDNYKPFKEAVQIFEKQSKKENKKLSKNFNITKNARLLSNFDRINLVNIVNLTSLSDIYEIYKCTKSKDGIK